MFKHTRVLATATLLVPALLAVPAASASNASSAAAHKAAPARFLILSNNPDENADSIVIANGAIHAKGVDHVLNNTHDRFTFPTGSVNIAHHMTKGSGHDTFDKKTCYATHVERGTWKANGGSGAYSRAAGSGTYFVLVKAVGCDQSKPPEYIDVQVAARGSLTF